MGGRAKLSPKSTKEEWGFIANEQIVGVSGWKITKMRHQEEGNSC